MMYSCRKVALLKSESFHRSLSTKERIGLQVHYLMCAGCKQVGKQLEFLHKASQQVYCDLTRKPADEEKLSHQARDRIRTSVNDELEK